MRGGGAVRRPRAGCYPSAAVAGRTQRRGAWGARTLLWAAAALGVCGAASAATIEGQVFDREGRPLAGAVVAVSDRSRDDGGEDELLRTMADARGFFTFDLGPRTLKGRILVGVVADKGWDALRYAPPTDMDVTAQLRAKGRAVVAYVVEDAAGWPDLARQIKDVGGLETSRGRILRRLGPPPETVSRPDGLVEWRYPAATYVFKDGALAETRRAGEDAK